MNVQDFDSLYSKVMNLNELLWERRANGPTVRKWLDNFSGKCLSPERERHHGIYLLSKFLFFGHKEVRELLRAMYEDLFKSRLSMKIRERQEDRDDFDSVRAEFSNELRRTRFLGLGNPAESGTHILYDFRIINRLPVSSFANPHDPFSGRLDDPATVWDKSVHRLIFLDDFCGSGSQGLQMGTKYVPMMRDVARNTGIDIEAWYLTLLGTTRGLGRVKSSDLFDHVEAVSELDDTYRAYGDESQIFRGAPPEITQGESLRVAREYGYRLVPFQPLGYEDCQLLIGFHHNVPDNTLPIMSREGTNFAWYPIFPRAEKYV